MLTAEKPPLAKQRSYVLKTSLLQEALAEARIDADVHLVYWTPQIDGSTLEAEYWLPNQNVPHPRVYVRAGSLPREQRHDAFEKLKASGLPAFVEWLSRILSLPENSPVLQRRPYFVATYRQGDLDVRHGFLMGTDSLT